MTGIYFLKPKLLLCFLIIMGCDTFTDPSVDEIIEKYIFAIGGIENIESVNTKEFRGHYIEPGYDLLIKAKVRQKRPHYRIIGDIEDGFAEGYDGSSWEYQEGKAYRSQGEAEAATRRGAEFDESLINYEEKGHKAMFLGRKIINGREVYEIEMTLNEGWVKYYYIDVTDYLLVALRKAMPLHAKGDDIDYLVTIDDYKEVEGILYPFTQIERDYYTGKMISATIWDKLIVNHALPDSIFTPAGLKK